MQGLSALSLDALTSVAYGPEAIILVLAVAGAGALHLVLPITIAIIALLAILVFSYRQVIVAYPGGGGAYAVSRANLGAGTSLVAAASLVVDYTLTVAVSIAAGVASLTSAFPSLAGATVPLCLGHPVGHHPAQPAWAGRDGPRLLLPTMLFIFGLARHHRGRAHPSSRPARTAAGPITAADERSEGGDRLPRPAAFSAGCSALTGVEAIANGVPLFREPRVVRAKRTEVLLGVILGTMLLGLAILAKRWQIGPRTGQTVLSQIMAMAVGRGWAYFIVSITITVVLALAANTSFGGLPILSSLLARDNYMPHLFALRGDRQVFSNGIVVLSLMAAALMVAVRGNTNTLIPLFAIGVFVGFTLSQTGLVVHWRRDRPPGWRRRAAINGVGAVVTGVATIVFLVSKFTEGAWVVVIAVPAFILLFQRIHAYYEKAGVELGIDQIAGQAGDQAHDRHRPGQPPVPAHRPRADRGQVDGPGGQGRHRRAPGGRRGHPLHRHPARAMAQVGPRGCPPRGAQRVRLGGTAHRGVHRDVGGTTPTTRSSCSSRWCARTTCASASCTTRSTSCCPGPCAAGPTSWWPAVTTPLEPPVKAPVVPPA